MTNKLVPLGFYQRYKENILFNGSLIIAGSCSLVLASFFAQFYYHQSNNTIVNSILTLVVEYSIDTPIFAALYYKCNRYRYVDNLTGKKDSENIKHDIKKLFAAFSISEIMYSVTKIAAQYQLLEQIHLQPFQASAFSSLLAWMVFFILVNVTMKAVAVYRKEELLWYCLLISSITIVDSFIIFSDPSSRYLYTDITLVATSAVAFSAAGLIVIFGHKKKKKKDFDTNYDKNNNKIFVPLAIGLGLWSIAEFLWGYYQLGLKIEVPFPSIADGFWLSGYGFFAYHLYAVLNRLMVKKINRRLFIIISLVVAATLSSVLYLIFSTTTEGLFVKQDPLSSIVSIAYPILDGILLVPAAAILWSLRRGDPAFTHWILISAFIVINTVADNGFAYSIVFGDNVEHQQEWIWDTLFNAGYLCVIAALFWYHKFYSSMTRKVIEQEA